MQGLVNVASQMKQPSQCDGAVCGLKTSFHGPLIGDPADQDVISRGRFDLYAVGFPFGLKGPIDVVPLTPVMPLAANLVRPCRAEHENEFGLLTGGRIFELFSPPASVPGVMFQKSHCRGNRLWMVTPKDLMGIEPLTIRAGMFQARAAGESTGSQQTSIAMMAARRIMGALCQREVMTATGMRLWNYYASRCESVAAPINIAYRWQNRRYSSRLANWLSLWTRRGAGPVAQPERRPAERSVARTIELSLMVSSCGR